MLNSVLNPTKLGPVINTLRRFRKTLFDRHLLLTNVSISFTLSGLGDVLQQKYMVIQGKSKQWDSTRTKHMSITGVTVGFCCHFWYNYLDRVIPERTLKAVMKKVMVDQLVASPVMITVFFLTAGLLEGSPLSSIVSEAVKKGWRMYAAEWIVWPPAQVVNFYLLPTKYRVLYDNTISLGYDVYTSYVKHDLDD